MSLLDLLGRGFGQVSATTPPATPILTWVDSGDGTGGTATIAGSTTGSANQLYTSATGSSWTLAGSRTGNGDISVTLSAGIYFAYVRSTKDGASSVSAVYQISIAATSTTDCIPIRIAAAVATEINLAAAAGDLSKSFTAIFSFGSEITKLEDVNDGGLVVDVLPAQVQEWGHVAGGKYRHAVTVKVGIRRRIASTDRTEAGTVDTTDVTGYVNLLYEIISLFAVGRNLTSVADAVWNSGVQPTIQLYDEQQLKSGLYVGWGHLPFLYHEPVGV